MWRVFYVSVLMASFVGCGGNVSKKKEPVGEQPGRQTTEQKQEGSGFLKDKAMDDFVVQLTPAERERRSKWEEVKDVWGVVDSVDQMPEMIYEVSPAYPYEAKQKGQQGTVWVYAIVDKQGKVLASEIAKSSGHSLLDDSVLAASYENRFNPGLVNGQPVVCSIVYRVDFLLSR